MLSKVFGRPLRTMSLCELSRLVVQILDTLRFLSPFEGLGTMYDVDLGLVGKRVVKRLVLIALFRQVLRLMPYERK